MKAAEVTSDECPVTRDGGPAFPQPPVKWNDGNGDCVVLGSVGMSLRDVFAAAALPIASKGGNRTGEAIAKRAYYLADAMLAEREKGGAA